MRQEYERGKSFTVTVNRCLRALRFTLTNPQRKSTKSRRYARRYKRSTVSAITGPRLLPSSQYFTFQEPHRSPRRDVTGRCSYCSRTNKDLCHRGQPSRKETSRFWAAVNYYRPRSGQHESALRATVFYSTTSRIYFVCYCGLIIL